jgi:hypothetical protein
MGDCIKDRFEAFVTRTLLGDWIGHRIAAASASRRLRRFVPTRSVATLRIARQVIQIDLAERLRKCLFGHGEKR